MGKKDREAAMIGMRRLQLPDGTVVGSFEVHRSTIAVPDEGMIRHLPANSGWVRWEQTDGSIIELWECFFISPGDRHPDGIMRPVYSGDPRIIESRGEII